MIDTIIVSGGNIQKDFALGFLKETLEKEKGIAPKWIAADRGVEFFMAIRRKPDVAVGDFDSLSEKGKEYLKCCRETEIIGLVPEKTIRTPSMP